MAATNSPKTKTKRHPKPVPAAEVRKRRWDLKLALIPAVGGPLFAIIVYWSTIGIHDPAHTHASSVAQASPTVSVPTAAPTALPHGSHITFASAAFVNNGVGLSMPKDANAQIDFQGPTTFEGNRRAIEIRDDPASSAARKK